MAELGPIFRAFSAPGGLGASLSNLASSVIESKAAERKRENTKAEKERDRLALRFKARQEAETAKREQALEQAEFEQQKLRDMRDDARDTARMWLKVGDERRARAAAKSAGLDATVPGTEDSSGFVDALKNMVSQGATGFGQAIGGPVGQGIAGAGQGLAGGQAQQQLPQQPQGGTLEQTQREIQQLRAALQALDSLNVR